MNKGIKGIVAALITATGLIANGFLYPDTMIITEIDEEEDHVTMECANGNQFQMYGVEDYFIGDLVSCIMYNNGTDVVYDDVILDAEYAGTAEMFMDIERR